jgi:hypothetical protein
MQEKLYTVKKIQFLPAIQCAQFRSRLFDTSKSHAFLSRIWPQNKQTIYLLAIRNAWRFWSVCITTRCSYQQQTSSSSPYNQESPTPHKTLLAPWEDLSVIFSLHNRCSNVYHSQHSDFANCQRSSGRCIWDWYFSLSSSVKTGTGLITCAYPYAGSFLHSL